MYSDVSWHMWEGPSIKKQSVRLCLHWFKVRWKFRITLRGVAAAVSLFVNRETAMLSSAERLLWHCDFGLSEKAKSTRQPKELQSKLAKFEAQGLSRFKVCHVSRLHLKRLHFAGRRNSPKWRTSRAVVAINILQNSASPSSSGRMPYIHTVVVGRRHHWFFLHKTIIKCHIFWRPSDPLRGANLRQIRIFFEHCSKGGGGVKPMFKKYVANFVWL